MNFRKPELIPLVFIVGAITLLMSLGLWQVQRLQWKNAQVEMTQQAQSMPALGALPQEITGLEYRNVMLTGTFLHDKTLHMVGKPQGQGMGFFIVTPFVLEDDGRIILVNRGFSPPDKESKPAGLQTVQGIIRPARLKRMFSPENRADKNVWFFEDMAAMSAYTGQTLTPIIVEATGTAGKDVYPVPGDGKITLRNDHLTYAITWFSLALIAIVMFTLYHRKHD